METPKTDFLEKLAEIRAAHCSQIPTPQMAVLTRLTARLRRSGILKKCVQAGETAPDFSFVDHSGKEDSLYGILAQGPVVLNFFRGLWCPYCKTEFEAFESVRARLTSLGCQYLAITPQESPTENEASSDCELIFDESNRIAHKFDLVYRLSDDEVALFNDWGVDFARINESDECELPLPATYLVATDRTVAYQFVDVDFRTRCCPDDLVAEVQSLARE